MCGKAQPEGRPTVELIETPVLLFASCGRKYMCNATFWLTTSCCNRKISATKLRNREIELYICPQFTPPPKIAPPPKIEISPFSWVRTLIAHPDVCRDRQIYAIRMLRATYTKCEHSTCQRRWQWGTEEALHWASSKLHVATICIVDSHDCHCGGLEVTFDLYVGQSIILNQTRTYFWKATYTRV